MCEKLKKPMHGTRDEAHNMQRRCAKTVRALGFATGKVLPFHFFQKGWQVCGRVRGGDFVVAGKSEFLQFIVSHMAEMFKVQVATTGLATPAVLCVLSRSIRWSGNDLRELIDELQWGKTQSVITPVTRGPGRKSSTGSRMALVGGPTLWPVSSKRARARGGGTSASLRSGHANPCGSQ